jgi:hypothetical protein
MMMSLFFLYTLWAQPGIADPNRFNNYLVLGYALMWLIGVVYLVSLANRQRNIQHDIDLMKQILQEDEERAER